MSNISKEDYLRVIYKNLEDLEIVNPTMIAEQLNVSNAAVTDMLRKLTKEKYVSYTPYKGIQLLEKGKNEAIKLVRRHRIWETFLYKVIGLPYHQIDEEAENLEHSSSDDLIDRLEEIMNFPEFDPHGHPIPSKNGKIPKLKKAVSLDKLGENESGIIQRVNDHSKDLLKYLFDSGLIVGNKVTVLEKRSFDNSMVVNVENKKHSISEKISQNIFVEKIK
ncbi:MAG: metal-dependent transcriptional regulator [Ignavibacteria bacterium]|jgi:DtxR family Mn-dependent transcriptional regulator|nr:metal-dependent transcriptional regulator [Ignavibacteria bacterium]MDH7528655.1 metal-dependent transcriptional regulator [Ignavibacteria bacterium]